MACRFFVHVTSDIDASGFMMPRTIFWKDGRIFRVDAVMDFRPVDSAVSRLPGDCYTVVINGKTKYLYFERDSRHIPSCIGRWFVLVN